jgi:tetratricopeptide (TPR) repeat protein
MKRIIVGLVLVSFGFTNAQTKTELINHFEAYYKQMKSQGDVQGVTNALTHLNILVPSQARKDTLAILYMNAGKHIQALNTIGIEKNTSDSDIAVEVKAVSLQKLNKPKLAVVHFEELNKRNPNALIAYELAELKTQLDDLVGATKHINYGIANSKEDIMRTFSEGQKAYQVPMKAAFLYLKSLVKYKENPKTNIDAALVILDEALAVAPNFNLAKISKDALKAQKTTPQKGN